MFFVGSQYLARVGRQEHLPADDASVIIQRPIIGVVV
jgi:hypothetical protein